MKKSLIILVLTISLTLLACNSQKQQSTNTNIPITSESTTATTKKSPPQHLTTWQQDIANFKYEAKFEGAKKTDLESFYKNFPKSIKTGESYYSNQAIETKPLSAAVYIFEYDQKSLDKIIKEVDNQHDQTIQNGATVNVKKITIDSNTAYEVLSTNKKNGINNVNYASIWKSGKFLISITGYQSTGIPDEILSKYLDIYPSDL